MTKPVKIYHVVAAIALILTDADGKEFRIEADAPAKLSEEQYQSVSAYVKVTKVEGEDPPITDTNSEPTIDVTTTIPDATAPSTAVAPVELPNESAKAATKTTKTTAQKA